MSGLEIRTERADLYDVNMIIVMRIRIEGSINNAEEAFSKAVSNNEVLNTKVVIEEDGRAFYEPNNTPRSFIMRTDKNLDKVRQQQEKIRFRLEEGEFIRAYINNGEILFLMHHLGGDGKSLSYFIEDFLTAASGEELTYKPMHEVELPVTSAGIKGKFFAHLLNRGWTDRTYTWDDQDKAYGQYWAGRTTVIEEKEEDLSSTLNMLHDEKIGYTAYLIAGYLHDMDKKADVGIAVDARQKGDRSMGNLATGISFKYRYDKRKDRLGNAKAIHKLIHGKLASPYKKYFILNFMPMMRRSLTDAINLVHAGTESDPAAVKAAKALGYLDDTKDLSVTNLTSLDIRTDYNGFRLVRLSFTGPVVSYGKNIVSCCTLNNVTVTTRHTRISAEP